MMTASAEKKHDAILEVLVGAAIVGFVIAQLFVLTHIEYQLGQILLGILIPIVLATFFAAFAMGYRSAPAGLQAEQDGRA